MTEFTDAEMRVIARLVRFAAGACREDVMGAILYTGAFHFLKEESDPVLGPPYKALRRDAEQQADPVHQRVVDLARKIEAHEIDDEEFSAIVKKNFRGPDA
jgi:hypothetical protein